MAIILSFFTGEQICEDCAQHSATPCTKCSPATEPEAQEAPPEQRDRLALDTAAE